MLPVGSSGTSLSHYNPYSNYHVYSSRRTDPASGFGAISPVTPVRQAPQVDGNEASVGYYDAPTMQPAAQPSSLSIPQGADPVEMAVRSRIQYLDDQQVDALIAQKQGLTGQDAKAIPAEESAEPTESAEATEAAEKTSPSETVEESECQTCKERKYQDGSDDPGVSFKVPGHIAPEQSASTVRGHEMEHVTRERAQAQREGREVVKQSVTLHTSICPECGTVYTSGGTTQTTTRAAQQDDQKLAWQQKSPFFEAVA